MQTTPAANSATQRSQEQCQCYGPLGNVLITISVLSKTSGFDRTEMLWSMSEIMPDTMSDGHKDGVTSALI